VEEKSDERQNGYIYIAVFFAIILFQTVIRQQYSSRVYSLGMCVKSVVIALVYKKVILFVLTFFDSAVG